MALDSQSSFCASSRHGQMKLVPSHKPRRRMKQHVLVFVLPRGSRSLFLAREARCHSYGHRRHDLKNGVSREIDLSDLAWHELLSGQFLGASRALMLVAMRRVRSSCDVVHVARTARSQKRPHQCMLYYRCTNLLTSGERGHR